MSIKEIKDVKKLQEILKDEMELRKYTYECCIKAGEELAKNSFAWDGKGKNLVVQAMELNKKYEQAKQKLEEIEKIAKDFHYAIIPFHRGINHEMADRIDYYLNQILQIIDEVE